MNNVVKQIYREGASLELGKPGDITVTLDRLELAMFFHAEIVYILSWVVVGERLSKERLCAIAEKNRQVVEFVDFDSNHEAKAIRIAIAKFDELKAAYAPQE